MRYNPALDGSRGIAVDPAMLEERRPNNPNKLLGLEIVRFVSAFAVLIFHYQHFSYIADQPTNFVKDSQPFYSLFGLFYEYGFLGVLVFWCVSGFIFFWKYSASISGGAISGRTFFVLRFSRLYPLHIVTLLLAALLQLVYFGMNNYFFAFQQNTLIQFALQLFMANGWRSEAINSFNAPIWSISVEILVYFAFYMILRVAGGSWIISAAVTASAAAWMAVLGSGNLAYCFYFFYAGGLCAMVRQSISSGSVEVAADIAAFCLLFLIPSSGWIVGAYKSASLFNFVLLTFIPALVFLASRHNLGLGPRAVRYIEAAGNMTYSSYLAHFPIQLGIATIFSVLGAAIPYYSPTFFGVFLSITLVAAYLIYRHFERPAQDAIRKRML
jgi:peptidoglycan/LPS O-acetylase OafA/YrhL